MPGLYTGGTFVGRDEEQAEDVIWAAEGAGYKFMEVVISPQAKIQDARIAGLLCVKHYVDGMDQNNMPMYSFNVSGGYVEFKFSKRHRARVALVLDDEEPGIVSKKGYNRDFFASHYSSGNFVIRDPEIAKDIQRRAVLMKKRAEEKKAAIQLKVKEQPDDIDHTIEALKEQQNKIAEKIEALTTQREKTPDPEADVQSDIKKAKGQEWAEEMKKRREALRVQRAKEKQEEEQKAAAEAAKAEEDKPPQPKPEGQPVNDEHAHAAANQMGTD